MANALILLGCGSGGAVGPVAPDTPTGFAATAGNQQITLSWDNQPSADTFEVKYGTTNVLGSATVLTSAATGTSFVFDSGESIQAGEKYYFWISATNGAGTSSFSSSVTARSYVTVAGGGGAAALTTPTGTWTLSTLFFGLTQPTPLGVYVSYAGEDYAPAGGGLWENSNTGEPATNLPISGNFTLVNTSPTSYTFWNSES